MIKSIENSCFFVEFGCKKCLAGEMAEWLNAADSKSVVPVYGTGGSNPPLSASCFVLIKF